ncbi:membrane cofactor protein-like [Phyllostomus discolor]|uniref:Membrane cofactor protein n=1 Tax=Phyllostomus discolor TaxID=89673 RepID=A0A7E6CX43_9CHIR|nr:membrane cofactor protein-like [Phyllostomus discolor]
MRVCYKLHKAPIRHLQSLFSSSCFLGILLVALVLLLPISSGRRRERVCVRDQTEVGWGAGCREPSTEGTLLSRPDACGAPPTYVSMMLQGHPNDVYQPGDHVEYRCRPGYMHISFPLYLSSVCRSDNTWEPLHEACAKKLCLDLGDPTNGKVVYVNGTHEFGSQAHYVCNDGYYLIGKKILHCVLSGTTVEWSGNPPQCEKILCQPPGKIANGIYTNSHKDTFEYNEIVIYACNPSKGPDEYSLVGESRLVCTGHNQWSSDPPACKVVKCQYPVLANGRLVSGFRKKFYYKAMCTVECLKGFYLEGSSIISCGPNNTWEPKMPTCVKGTKGVFYF